MPGGTNGFVAVTRLFSSNHLAPPGPSVGFDTNQEYEPRIDATKAGFERLVEWQAHRSHFNSLDRQWIGNEIQRPGHNFGARLHGWARLQVGAREARTFFQH